MMIELVAILPSPKDRRDLSEIISHSNWRLDLAESLDGSQSALNKLRQGIVVCDSQLPDGNWKNTLDQLESRAVPLPLIVASRRADDRLWAEVLNLGGRDVLAMPFDPDEVIRSVSLAWRVRQNRP